MPAYNAEKYIEAAIKSVQKQDYSDWELIIVDDGSTDSTAFKIQQVSKNDNRIKYFYKINEGQGIAKNYGLSKSTGELVAFLDSDDYWLPTKLSITLREFSLIPTDLLFTRAYIFYNDSDLISTSKLSVIGSDCERIYEGTDGISQFIIENRVPMLTVLASKNILLKVNGFPDIHVAEDYYLWLKLLFENYKIRGLNQILSAYRVHPNSIMNEKKSDICEVIEMIILLSKDYPELLTKYKRETKERIIFYLNNVFTNHNYNELKYYLKSLNHLSLISKMIFNIHNFISFRVFRKLIRKSLVLEK